MDFTLRGCADSGQGQGLEPKFDEMLQRLVIIIVLWASDQKAIEHSTSDVLVAIRYELVELYALAFREVAELESIVSHSFPKKTLSLTIKFKYKIEDVQKFEQRNERFESVMKIARLQELSMETLFLDQMHRDLLAKM
jgi:hypothetical protein